jgi:hypothetical protein
MAQTLQKPVFTLIKSPKRRQITDDFFPRPLQAELFASYSTNVLIFVTLAKTTNEEFLKILDHSKLGLIFDIRRFPRFDIGSLTRQKAFEEFDRRHIDYVDYACSWSDVEGPDFACPYLRPEIHRLRGIVMFLLEDRPYTSEVERTIVEQCIVLTRESWDVIRIPSYLPNSVSSNLAVG